MSNKVKESLIKLVNAAKLKKYINFIRNSHENDDTTTEL